MGRTAAIKAGAATEELPDFLPVVLAPAGDIETLALAGQVGDALKRESEVRDDLLKVYGTEEQAVIALGSRIAARAEELAGITGEEARAGWLLRFDAACDAEEAATSNGGTTEADRIAAASAFKVVYSGQDPDSLRAVRHLADGYRQALAEVREIGGEMTFSDLGEKPAEALFAEAADGYPADWLRKSDAFGQPPAAFLTKAFGAMYINKIRMPDPRAEPVLNVSLQQMRPSNIEWLQEEGFATCEQLTAPPPGEEPPAAGKEWFRVQSWDVKPKSPAQPDGDGWEIHEPSGNWRRPQTKLPVIELPTITATDHTRNGVAGRPLGYSTAVHELSHRFEHSLVEIPRLESAFIIRRTTIDGEREPLVNWNPAMPEAMVRKDHFVDTYVGRDYPKDKDGRNTDPAEAAILGNAEHHGSAYEVLSTGTEALFGGEYGGLIGIGKWRPDDEHRSFVLGTMAAAGRP